MAGEVKAKTGAVLINLPPTGEGAATTTAATTASPPAVQPEAVLAQLPHGVGPTAADSGSALLSGVTEPGALSGGVLAQAGRAAQARRAAPADPIAQRGAEVFRRFRSLGRDGVQRFQKAAEDVHGLPPKNWYIYRSPAMRPYAPIYGMIADSAQRHGLKPEFLHAVVMGENLNGFIDRRREDGIAFDPDTEIDAFQSLGLDEIGDPDHIQALIDEAGLDPAIRDKITSYTAANELGEQKTTGTVRGYAAAIELVAAELHYRRDKVVASARAQGIDLSTFPTREGYEGFAVDFLTYAAFNNPSVARDALADPATYLRVYDRVPRGDQRNVRYNALLRLVTADWIRRAGVYDE